MAHPMKDVVVVIPGILGSVLRRGDDDVWAPSRGALWNFFRSRSRSLRDLALDEEDDGSLDDLGDGVVATGLMPDIHFVPGLWGIDGYGRLGDVLADRFELRPGRNYHEFPYDWRRNNRAHGRRLRRESERWLAEWRAESGNADAKLIILAHSMGGLVARSFLELEGGWEDTDSLITFGTPFDGSLNALDFLVNGFRKGFGVAEIDLSDLLRSLTSVYQLLPTFPCIDTGEPQDPAADPDAGLIDVLTAADRLAGLDGQRARNALDFHRALDEAAAAAAHGGADIHPIAGIRQPTLQRAELRAGALTTLTDWNPDDPAESFGGDGTVPIRSAVPREMRRNPKGAMFSAIAHGSLQNDDANLAHIEGLITVPDLLLPESQPAALTYLSLDVDDSYRTDEPLTARIGSSEPGTDLTLTVTSAVDGSVVAHHAVDNPDDRAAATVELPTPPEGTYWVTVDAPAAPGVTEVRRPIIVWS